MTLKEIARELGVSPSTVSRALNGYTKNFTISQELRDRIREHAEKRGYRANPIFSSMKARKNKQIGILFYSRSSMGTGYTVENMVDQAVGFFESKDYEINYIFSRMPRQFLKYSLPPWKVAGLLIPDCINANSLSNIEKAGIPYVCMNGVTGLHGISVQVDEADGMRQIIEHLASLGHKGIAFLAPPISDLAEFDILSIRKDTFLSLSSTYGISPVLLEIQTARLDGYTVEKAKVVSADNSFSLLENKPNFIQQLYRHGTTAIICMDNHVLEVLYQANHANIRVPEQLSLVAYNDVPMLKRMLPAITAFQVPSEGMGQLAAKILYEKLCGKDTQYKNGMTMRLKGKVIVRQSTAGVLPC